MSGYREELRGEWLGYPVGLGYTIIKNKFTLYMIQQSEQNIIEITDENQTKLFHFIPMAQIDKEPADWLMNESKSKLKPFHGIEEYEEYRKKEHEEFMKS